MNHKRKFQTKKAPNKFSHTLSWSPLPLRNEKLNFAEKNFQYDLSKNNSYYPNCDVNVWLRSCEKEVADPLKGTISGVIPLWLKGSLLRNGPGSLKVGNDYFAHLFDSSALLHRFGIENGKVTYQCRFLQSEVFKRNWKANRIVYTEFGTKAVADPCHSIFQRVAAVFNPKLEDLSDNSMISLYPFGDEVYAFGETPVIHQINPENLETINKVDVSDYVSIVHHTAHPHISEDGSIYNLALSMYPTGPYQTIVKFAPIENGSKSMVQNATLVAGIPARWPLHPPYMHTFGITDNYFIIVEQPLSISLPATLMSRIKNEPLAGSFRWYQEEQTQISLINRKTGLLECCFFAEAFFFLHIINQYEISDYVVLDICIYQDPSMLDCMYIETMKTMQQNENYARMFRSKPVRFVLPLKPKRTNNNLIKLKNFKAEAYFQADNEILVKPEKLSDLGCETPRIHYEKYLGKKYRFFYAISADVDAENPGTIIKVDTVTKKAKTWSLQNCYPSEPIFVPNPNGEYEDDGVVLAAMVWGNESTNRAGLIVLDAKTFKEIGRAEFDTPGPVPKCLHGWYIPHKNPLH